MKQTLLSVRSALFTPATRIASLDRAFGSGADLVILDLEDAVAPSAKDEARAAVVRLSADRRARVALRINAPTEASGLADLLLLREIGGWRAVMLPKVQSPVEVELARGHINAAGHATPLLALIETAAGLEAAPQIASHPSVVALALGGADLATDLGVSLGWTQLLAARSRLVQAGAMGQCPAWDVPSLNLDDDSATRAEAEAARDIGMKAKLAVHPRQVAAVNAAFTPDGAAIHHARRVLEALENAKGGVCQLDGRMIDRPVALAARALLLRAGHIVKDDTP